MFIIGVRERLSAYPLIRRLMLDTVLESVHVGRRFLVMEEVPAQQ